MGFFCLFVVYCTDFGSSKRYRIINDIIWSSKIQSYETKHVNQQIMLHEYEIFIYM
jgi:hypothetical protein